MVDACSSLLLLVGFHFSSREEDSRHPHGHGRIEYIAGLLISEMILAASFSLARESADRILHPHAITCIGLILLTASLGTIIKLAICIYIKSVNKDLQSPAAEAYYKDTRMDAVGIIPIVAGVVLQQFTAFPVDGIVSLFLAGLIAADGLQSFAKNASLLIGEGLSDQKKEQISALVNSYREFAGITSLTVNDYGPGQKSATLIIRVNPHAAGQKIDTAIKSCTAAIQENLGIEISIHIDAKCNFLTGTMFPANSRKTALQLMQECATTQMYAFFKRKVPKKI